MRSRQGDRVLGGARYERAEEAVSHRNGYEPRRVVPSARGMSPLDRRGMACEQAVDAAGAFAGAAPGVASLAFVVSELTSARQCRVVRDALRDWIGSVERGVRPGVALTAR